MSTAIKTYKADQKVSTHLRRAIINTVDFHERYKKAYFWSPPGNAGSRRREESRFAQQNPSYRIEKDGKVIEVHPAYSLSCKNCYYSLTVLVNGKKADVRAIKNLANI